MTSLYELPMQPPLLDDRGEPQQCWRCGGIFERPVVVDGKLIRGHDVTSKACIPMKGTTAPHDARERKAARARL